MIRKVNNSSYTNSIEVPFSPKVVFDQINNVSKWWPEDFEGECSKLSDEFTFRTGDVHYSKQRIVEFVPGRKVVWLVTESIRKTDNYEWTGAEMTFELSPHGDNTLLKFTYSGPVAENEYDRLVQLCDLVIKEKLFNLVVG